MSKIQYLSSVLAPLVLSQPEDVAWDDETDLVVVGFGGVGTSTAFPARGLGGDVLALELARDTPG